jgi:hypothetical protein
MNLLPAGDSLKGMGVNTEDLRWDQMNLPKAGDSLEGMGVRKYRRFKIGSDELTGGWRVKIVWKV